MYLGHGLTSTDISYFLPNIIKTLPVCELKSYNWRQSDDASTFSPPCDCRKSMHLFGRVHFANVRVSLVTATDQWGDKFMDVAQDDVKAWINAGCQ